MVQKYVVIVHYSAHCNIFVGDVLLIYHWNLMVDLTSTETLTEFSVKYLIYIYIFKLCWKYVTSYNVKLYVRMRTVHWYAESWLMCLFISHRKLIYLFSYNEFGNWICLQLQSYNTLGTLEISKMGISGHEVSNSAVTFTSMWSYLIMFDRVDIIICSVFSSLVLMINCCA